MKKETWLLVANSSLARIYKVGAKQSLVEVEVLEHPESRLYTHDLVSDKQGTDFESVGNARHRVQPHTTPKQLEFAIFANQLAKRLELALGNGDIGKLYIAASPTLLGLLRNALHPNVTKLIGGEVDKDMTHMKPDEISSTLPFLFYA